jgi:hypothetical protein
VKDLCNENYKPLKKETEDYKIWKDIPCAWVGRINSVTVAILSKVIYTFNAIPIKIPMTCHRDGKMNSKAHLEAQKIMNSQGNTEQKRYTGGITTLDFKVYYRVIAIKRAWYWHKNRYEDQWNRTEDLDKNPCSNVHLNFDKGAQNIQ